MITIILLLIIWFVTIPLWLQSLLTILCVLNLLWKVMVLILKFIKHGTDFDD